MKKIEKIKKRIKKNRKLYFIIHNILFPYRSLQNRNRFNKHYDIFINNLRENKDSKKIFLIGIPIHSNLGDQAQYLCIKEWIKNNFKNYVIIEIPDCIIYRNNNTIKEIKQIISNDDIFVFQSGYRTTDVANFFGEHSHQSILNNFKNKVIVFPQTVNFKLENEKKKSIQAYAENNNYLFMARDKISYEIALSMYDKERVLLYPDIVTTLIGNYDKSSNNNKEGILFCIRNDDEKLYTDKEYNILINSLKNITDKIDITDTNSTKNFEYDRSEAEDELKKKLDQIASYKLIITDRFHGTIFSLITSTPVIVLNSTDHKLSSGVDWFKDIYDDYIFYCKDLDNVYEIAKNIYNKEFKSIKKAYFKDNYYDKLIDIINKN